VSQKKTKQSTYQPPLARLSACSALLLIAACGDATTDITPASAPEPVVEAPIVTASPQELHATRVADLSAVQGAIEAYHLANGEYPSTQENWRGVAFGHGPGANWIPGLVPDFIASLPRDPALGETKAEPQYIYISDGSGYKLIVHNASDVALLEEGGAFAIDPVRPETGYGVWTDNMVDF